MASGNENSLFLHLPVNLEKALIDMVNPRGALIQHKELFDLCDPEAGHQGPGYLGHAQLRLRLRGRDAEPTAAGGGNCQFVRWRAHAHFRRRNDAECHACPDRKVLHR